MSRSNLRLRCSQVHLRRNSPRPRNNSAHTRGGDRSCMPRVSKCDSSSSCRVKRRRTYDENAQVGSCSRDPIGYRGSKWNSYEMVSSNPLRQVDPFGQQGAEPLIPFDDPTIYPPEEPPAQPLPAPDPFNTIIPVFQTTDYASVSGMAAANVKGISCKNGKFTGNSWVQFDFSGIDIDIPYSMGSTHIAFVKKYKTLTTTTSQIACNCAKGQRLDISFDFVIKIEATYHGWTAGSTAKSKITEIASGSVSYSIECCPGSNPAVL